MCSSIYIYILDAQWGAKAPHFARPSDFPTSTLKPTTSGLKPKTSGLKPSTSGLKPPKPHNLRAKAQDCRAKAQHLRAKAAEAPNVFRGPRKEHTY